LNEGTPPEEPNKPPRGEPNERFDPADISTRTAWRERVRGLAMDIGPLKTSRDYRLLWIGTSVSFMGSWMTFVAIPFQVYKMTGSTLAVGLLGLCDLVPLLTLSLFGGVLADSFDRRRLLLLTESLAALVSLGLALNASLAHPHLWALYAGTFSVAAMYALGSPAQRSSAPLLLPKAQIAAAAALSGAAHNLSSMLGPAIGGLIISTAGLTTTFLVDVGTFVFAVVCVYRMRPIPAQRDATKEGRASVLDGLRFLKGRPVLQGSFIVDINAMVFGMPYALFPAVARSFGGASVLGLLYAAPPAGAFLASLTSGWVNRVRRQGLVVYISVVLWGGALVVFGLSPKLWMALLWLAVAGAADAVSAIFRSTILQTASPPEMLGRLSGLEMSVVASGPSLGDLEAGALAALTSVKFSIVSGGVACIAGVGVMAVLLPAFHRYVAPTHESVSA
jgi:MFS family permease